MLEEKLCGECFECRFPIQENRCGKFGEKEKKMKFKEAIEVIKNNYPPENYTMLRDALDLAIHLLEQASVINNE